MNELRILQARSETERLLAGLVEATRDELSLMRAERDRAVALVRQIYGILMSDDVTINVRNTSMAERMAEWVGRSSAYAEDPFKIKKNFSARVGGEA